MIDRSADLVAQTQALLEPGDIELVGVIVHTEFRSKDELDMMDVTIEIGELIAAQVSDEPTYIYSGNDDPRFGTNQHQGLTIDGDDFVWECQQVLRDGSFDIVFYFEATPRVDHIVEAIEANDYPCTVVTA